MLIIRLVLFVAISGFSVISDAAQLKDPTRPGVSNGGAGSSAKTATASKLKLSVIKLEKEHRVAVINGKLYQQGQRIGQEQIKKIMLDKVIFSSGKELHLFGHSVVSVSQ